VEVFVQRLAGVLLQVGAGDTDRLFSSPPSGMSMLPPSTTGSSYWLIW
jgi:hypothetical protein